MTSFSPLLEVAGFLFRPCPTAVHASLPLFFRRLKCRVVGEDDFFADLGISYKDFDMPDEVDDFYEAKEDPVIAKDRYETSLQNVLGGLGGLSGVRYLSSRIVQDPMRKVDRRIGSSDRVGWL